MPRRRTENQQDPERALLDQLLEEARLYRTGPEYQKLLEFIVALRNVAPFNALIIHLQKPGVQYVASAYDWQVRFGRTIRVGARPLLILWPFGPVATVYDVHDTVGGPLPEFIFCFPAEGAIDDSALLQMKRRLAAKHIDCLDIDAGDGTAGWIRVSRRAVQSNANTPTAYVMAVNSRHTPATQFVTIAHELAHLFLGHLGADKALHAPDRPGLPLAQREIEAESVAYLVAARSGVKAKPQSYLSNYVTRSVTVESLDLYQITRAAGQVETLLQRTANTSFGPLRRSKLG